MLSSQHTIFFFFNDTATTEIYTLSLHDALPISPTAAGTARCPGRRRNGRPGADRRLLERGPRGRDPRGWPETGARGPRGRDPRGWPETGARGPRGRDPRGRPETGARRPRDRDPRGWPQTV